LYLAYSLPQALRLTVRTLALMRYPGPPEPGVVGTAVDEMRAVFEKGSYRCQ
jgi:hypothetical protein